jgi:hypothetical protein
MTSVSISAGTSTVIVAENGTTAVVPVPETSVVVATTQGPQGPQGATGAQGPPGASGLFVDTAAKVDKSVVYYDAPTSSFRADAIWTTTTIVDGANF